jgi:protein-disulfide isomerase
VPGGDPWDDDPGGGPWDDDPGGGPWDDDHDAGPGAAHGRPATVRRQNRVALFATVAMLVVLAFGGGMAVGRATAPGAAAATATEGGGSTAAGDGSTTSPGPVPTTVASAGASLPSDGPRLGRADAKVTVEYWADYQCPFCARFAREVIPQLESRIADGTVALVHRDYAFLGVESVDAAVAVRCAGQQGDYWAMHDAVYAAQAGENQGGFAPAKLAQIAASVGLDPARFTACTAERAPLVAVLDDTAAGVRTGIISTPTIDVNGNRFLGVPDVTKFLAAVDAAAAGASPAPLPTAPPSADAWIGTVTTGREAGGASAPVTVELWIDYQSTDSASVAKTLEPELRTRIASGAIRVVQRDLAVLGDESVVAASMVRCVAGQGGPAWYVNDILSVAAQGAGSGIFTTENLLQLGSRLGLDVKALDTCLADPIVAADVKAETAQGTALGLTAGPSVLIRAGDREVGRFSGPLDTTAVLAAIDAAK